MTLFDKLDKKNLKELLVKCWMTHDGSWFYNCARELGIDTANKLNKAAIKNLSVLEMQRIKKALGKDNLKIETFNQFRQNTDSIKQAYSKEFQRQGFGSTGQLLDLAKQSATIQKQAAKIKNIGSEADIIQADEKLNQEIDNTVSNILLLKNRQREALKTAQTPEQYSAE